MRLLSLEATEVVEAVEVIEIAKVLRPGNSLFAYLWNHEISF